MTDLCRVDQSILPRDPAFRPIERTGWYGRALPIAVGIGAAIGLLSTVLPSFFLWIAVLGVIGFSASRRRKMHQLLRDNDEGVALLQSGDLAEAGRVFDRLCLAARRMPTLHSIFVYNRAVVHLEAAELDAAISLLSAVVRAGWIGGRGALASHYPSVLGRLALAHALRGKVDVADAWRARAHTVITPAKRGILLLVDAVVEARQGRDDRAIELVDDNWARAENLQTAKQLRALRVVQAFCLERSRGPQYRAASRDADRRRAIEAASAGRRGEHDYLATFWPELAEFLGAPRVGRRVERRGRSVGRVRTAVFHDRIATYV